MSNEKSVMLVTASDTLRINVAAVDSLGCKTSEAEMLQDMPRYLAASFGCQFSVNSVSVMLLVFMFLM